MSKSMGKIVASYENTTNKNDYHLVQLTYDNGIVTYPWTIHHVINRQIGYNLAETREKAREIFLEMVKHSFETIVSDDGIDYDKVF